jgi:hypothetical protein
MLKLDKTQITRNLGKKYKYVPFLEKAIANFEDPWEFVYTEKEDDEHWHPSSHCIQPATELYAIARGEVEREQVSGSLRKIFQVGHFWHQWLQHITLHKLEMCTPDAIERRGSRSWGDKETAKVGVTEGGLSAVDWKPAPYHSAAGSGDVAPLETPNWKGVVDYKTMNSANFAQAQIPSYYAAKYECQINIYMDFFDEAEAIILPINKDSCEFKEFLYARNQPLIDTIYEKWEFVSACLDADEAPTQADNDMFELDHLLTGAVST